MNHTELQNKYFYFPPPVQLSVWDKWLERQIFNNPYNHSNEAVLKRNLIKEYYGWREGLWMDYHKELATSGTQKT